ncbi:VCBS repeat-containing protein [Amycolatopsis sp. NPDC051102]|uniref:FG-GAP repeat domain-containing protein n=1 Tax=Amycolatopsis sp. NPDC051102 TaxID=3155163 RepID=UPI00342F7F5A
MIRPITTIVTTLLLGSSLVTGTSAAAAEPSGPAIALPVIPATSPLRELLRPGPGVHRQAHTALAAGRGDITGDGRPDLVTVSTGTNQISVHAGTADGTGAFSSSTTIGTTGADRTWIGQGDLTGDGNRDILTFATDGSMHIAAHSGTFDGTTTLNPEYTWSTGWQAGSLWALTDFVGRDPNDPTTLDGLADILFRYSGDNGYYLYVNEGPDANGRPQLSNRGKLLDNMQAVTSMSIADVTADGFPDLYMTFTDGSARLLDIFAELDSSGHWQAKFYTIQPTGVVAADTRTLTDVNGDGLPDLVIWHKATGTVTADLHSGLWNPATPSSLFDTAHERTLTTGWTGYRLAA